MMSTNPVTAIRTDIPTRRSKNSSFSESRRCGVGRSDSVLSELMDDHYRRDTRQTGKSVSQLRSAGEEATDAMRAGVSPMPCGGVTGAIRRSHPSRLEHGATRDPYWPKRWKNAPGGITTADAVFLENYCEAVTGSRSVRSAQREVTQFEHRAGPSIRANSRSPQSGQFSSGYRTIHLEDKKGTICFAALPLR